MENFNFDKFNGMIKKTISDYYKYQDADNFFHIDDMLNVCRNYGFTKEQVPQLIEMQNIILIG